MEIDDYLGYDFEIIDIRDENSFNNLHIDNARNISLNRLIANYEILLDKNKYYLLVCEYGIQSKIVMNMLNRLGYHTNSLKDGFRGLVRRGKIYNKLK